MKHINTLIVSSISAITIGAILSTFGNPVGPYLIISGVITGLYTMHLLDKEEGKNPENTI